MRLVETVRNMSDYVIGLSEPCHSVPENCRKKVLTLGTSLLLIYNSDNEQGFAIKMAGILRRSVIDLDGVQLIKRT